EAGTGSTATEQSATNISGGSYAVSGLLIRFNSAASNLGFAYSEGSESNVRVIGNVGGGSCNSGWTYGYNLWTTAMGGCASSDSTASSLPYMSNSQGSEDFNLKCGSTAMNLATPNTTDYQLNYDINNDARNANGPRDAGSAAEPSCGT